MMVASEAQVDFMPSAMPLMMIVAGPVMAWADDGLGGLVVVAGVVLGGE
jgi:hypothetical protein